MSLKQLTHATVGGGEAEVCRAIGRQVTQLVSQP